jgi:hypothetical protein
MRIHQMLQHHATRRAALSWGAMDLLSVVLVVGPALRDDQDNNALAGQGTGGDAALAGEENGTRI